MRTPKSCNGGNPGEGQLSNLDLIYDGVLSQRVHVFDIQRLCDHTCSAESQKNSEGVLIEMLGK